MSTSLGELLTKEGFKGRRTKTMSRASFSPEGTNIPRNLQRDPRKTVRTRSDIPFYDLKGDCPAGNRVRGRKTRDILDRGLNMDIMEKFDPRCPEDYESGIRSATAPVEVLPRTEIAKIEQNHEIAEIPEKINSKYRDIYSNDIYTDEGCEGAALGQIAGKERSGSLSIKAVHQEDKSDGSAMMLSYRHSRLGNGNLKGMEKPETSSSISSRSPRNSRNSKENRTRKKLQIEKTFPVPALDEAAVQAIISILCSHIKRFLNEDDYRVSLRHSSFASLNCAGSEEGVNTESKIIENLEQAIEAVERAAEQHASVKELKKASLQLSIITGLSSNDLRDGFSSGVSNYKLSACAHLYLSVVYKLQRKDKIAAKHLLQVFCDSPFQARISLLPDIWDHLFSPHFSHLLSWYNKEANHIGALTNKESKLKSLEKVYNEILDTGTYQFAVYYKDWLTDEVKAPSTPSIQPPSLSVRLIQQANDSFRAYSDGSGGNWSPQPIVSKKLYDQVFSQSQKLAVQLEYYDENFDTFVRSCTSSVSENTQRLKQPSETIKHMDGIRVTAAPDQLNQATCKNTIIFPPLPAARVNELIMKKVAKEVYELPQSKEVDNPELNSLMLNNYPSDPEAMPGALGLSTAGNLNTQSSPISLGLINYA